MARGYPRFLFSNPQNVKTPGPFIVHTLFPKFLCHVKHNTSGRPNAGGDVFVSPMFYIEILERWDEADKSVYNDVVFAMQKWLNSNEDFIKWLRQR